MSASATQTPPSAVGASLDGAAAVFKALSDATRLKILEHLAHQEEAGCCSPEGQVCACDLEEVTGLAQPTVSHHMKVLVAAGLVSGEKKGRWMYYRTDPNGFAVARRILAQLGS